MMRAVSQDKLGPPGVLHMVTVPRPRPGGTEVLVRVLAAGVNPVDWKTRADGGCLGPPPFILGWDVAGVVATVREGVTRFAVWDRVFGMPWFPRQAGAYAEYLTCPSRQLAATPGSLDDAQAAGLPLAGLIAWQSLIDTAAVKAGGRVLIQPAAGGVGNLAVQIAKHAEIRPFRVDMPGEAIADLRRLIADRSQGVQLATIRELARYWATEYDWRKCAAWEEPGLFATEIRAAFKPLR
jgi:NADPH:quinone reductase-like Zn-dependent oxidoreductase